MISIVTPYETWSRDRVDEQVNEIFERLATLEIDGGLAVYADLSTSGITLLLAAIKLGVPTAICSLREPPSVLKAWLGSLGIATLVSSVADVKRFDIVRNTLSIDDLPKSSTYAPKVAGKFSCYMRTSGTTARPKTAVLSEQALCASAWSVNQYFSYANDSCWALSLPLYHVSGLSVLFRALHARSKIFLVKNQDEIVAGFEKRAISHCSLVPTQLSRLFSQNVNLHDTSAVVLGGDAVPIFLKEEALRRRLPLFNTYGLTETASMIWVTDVNRDTGGLLPHAIMQFAPDDEILVGGQSLFDGYVVDGRVQRPLSSTGLFATGDVGYVRGSELFIHGRKHHRIISGGENIQAEEVERILDLHPLIEQSVVFGLPDADLGMRVAVFIKWRGPPCTTRELDQILRDKVAAHKIPKKFFAWPDHAPEALKKPRAWLSDWARSGATLTTLS